MTKKSQSRLQRDAYKANNTAWTDLQGVYNNTFDLMNSVSNQISGFFSIEGVSLFIPQAERTKTETVRNSMAADLKIFHEDLQKIRAGHINKTGALAEEDSLLQVLELSEAYTNLNTRFDAIITPSYQYLLAMMGIVEEATRLAAMEDPADPSVITDVVVKETPTDTPASV